MFEKIPCKFSAQVALETSGSACGQCFPWASTGVSPGPPGPAGSPQPSLCQQTPRRPYNWYSYSLFNMFAGVQYTQQRMATSKFIIFIL